MCCGIKDIILTLADLPLVRLEASDKADDELVYALLFPFRQPLRPVPFQPVGKAHVHAFPAFHLVGVGMVVGEQELLQPMAVRTYKVFF